MPAGDNEQKKDFMLKSIGDQYSFWVDERARNKDVVEQRRCVRQMDILQYDLNLTKMKLPSLQGTESIGEVAYKIMNANSCFDVMNFHSDHLEKATSKLSTEEGLRGFLTQVFCLSDIQDSAIPVQYYSVATTMRDDCKEMIELNAQMEKCGLVEFLDRAELMETNFKKGLTPTSEFFTKGILSKGECRDEKEYLLHDVNQRQILNKFYIASYILNELSNMKEPGTEDPINLWYVNIHTNKKTAMWLDTTYNLQFGFGQ